jgi:hypothetical protein
MTHDEYVSKLDAWTDEDAGAVLRHADSCFECRRESRAADRRLASFSPGRRSRAEEGVRILAAAAIFALVIWGIPAARNAAAPQSQSPARYRIVGTASGVVAETPEGLVAAGRPSSAREKEVSR